MRLADDGPVPDPPAPSYAGLNELLLRQREEMPMREKMAVIINDHAPVQGNRYLPYVECATPACNFRGVFGEHALHVADLILRMMR